MNNQDYLVKKERELEKREREIEKKEREIEKKRRYVEELEIYVEHLQKHSNDYWPFLDDDWREEFESAGIISHEEMVELKKRFPRYGRV